jgi:hypothetical protein
MAPSGMLSRIASTPTACTTASFREVLTKPGATAKAVMPSRPWWRAMVRVMATSPALDAA